MIFFNFNFTQSNYKKEKTLLSTTITLVNPVVQNS